MKFKLFIEWLLEQKNTRKFKYLDQKNCVFASFLKERCDVANPYVYTLSYAPDANKPNDNLVSFPEWAREISLNLVGSPTIAKVRRVVIAYFKNKLGAIPDEKWVNGSLNMGDGKHCLMGHLGCKLLNDELMTDEALALALLFAEVSGVRYLPTPSNEPNAILWRVNDGSYKENYKGQKLSTPKARVMRELNCVEREIAKK